MANKKKETNHKTKSEQVVNPIIAGVTGAAVGAGVGVVASAAINDESNRKKMGEALDTVRKQAMKVMDNMNTQDNIQEGKKAAKKMINNATKKIESTSKKAMNGRSHAHA